MLLALGWTLIEAKLIELILFAVVLFLGFFARAAKIDFVSYGLFTFLCECVGVISSKILVSIKERSELLAEGLRFVFSAFFSHAHRVARGVARCKLLFLRTFLITLIFSQVGWEEYKVVQIYEYTNQKYIIDGQEQVGTIQMEVEGDDFKPEILLIELTPNGKPTVELDVHEFADMFPQTWALFTQDWTSDLYAEAEARREAMEDR